MSEQGNAELPDASEARWRSLVEHNPDYILLTDRDTTIRYVNRTAHGFRQEDVVGRRADELVSPDFAATMRHLYEQTWDTGRPTDFETPVPSPDGTLAWYATRLVPIREGGQTVGLLAVAHEVTERKRAEEERAALDHNLRQTQKLESLGVLAGGIAHDFNNLLTGILGNANLARLESPGSAAAAYLDQIEQSCLRAADLCRQMLAYAGKGRFVVERLDLNRVIGDMTHLLQVSISKSAVLKYRPAPSLPSVSADGSQLRQVVMNLVINASEAVADRGGVVGLATGVVRVGPGQVRAAPAGPDLPPGEYVALEVSDDGPGMTEEVRAKIFDPFFTTKFTGRGLGLAAVLGIVRGHKGAIEVSTEPGRGTTIRVLFPPADGVVDAADGGGSPRPWRGEGTVLVADDEEAVRVVTARMLESVGFRVVMAEDGAGAVERFRADPGAYRLVLLDLTMPRLGGAEALHELRLVRPDVRVILMSGYTEHEVTARFADKGLAGFLQKPFPLPTLLAKVKQALG